MKKILVFVFALFITFLNAQNSNSTCATAQPFCANGNSGLTFPAVTATPASQAQVGPAYGCLGSQPNPSWYYLQISAPGTLSVLIQGTLTTPPTGPGQDVDFICWGPFSSLAGICNNLTAGNIVDCSFSGSFTETLTINNAVAGQYYMVLITNFANTVQNIVFQQFAGNGTTNCALLLSNSTICAGGSATLTGSNPSNLGNPTYSIQPGGLTNNTGTFVVSPSTTTNYTLYVTGANTPTSTITQTAVSSVTVNPQPNAVPTTTQSTCTNTLNSFNLGLTFNPSSPVPNYTVNWSPIPANINSPTQTTANASSPATYNATITAAGGCSVATVFTINPQPPIPVFTLTPYGTQFSVTCAQPTVTVLASDPNFTYNWNDNLHTPQTGVSADFTASNLGTWSVTATHSISSCTKTYTFNVSQNIALPTSTIAPLLQNITCANPAIITVTATSNPTINIQHNFFSPQGATVSANSPTTIFTPGPGTYTHEIVNLLNGCKVTKTFSVVPGGGFPTFSVNSPQNFTLGCTTHSVATINIPGGQTTDNAGNGNGGSVTYTLLPPTTGTNSYGTAPGISTYTVAVPGTWTVVVKDPSSGCETKVPISVIQNTFGPQIESIVPSQTLTCYTPSVLLQGTSTTSFVTYSWLTPAGNQVGSPLSIFTTTNVTNTLVANYVLTITDLNNACISNSTIPMYQNLFPPNVGVAPSGTAITCSTPTITLSNNSSVASPTNFPRTQVVQGYLWQGPPPQSDGQVSSTYVAYIPGTFTLTGKDLNNGCINTKTVAIAENRIFPVVNNPVTPPPFFLDCGSPTVAVSAIVTDPTSSYVYLWDVPVNSTISVITNSVLVVNLPGSYKVQVTNNSNGCASGGVVSVIIGTLTGSFVPDQLTGYAPLTVNFTNSSASSSSTTPTANINSVWNFGNGTSSVTPSSSITPSAVYNQPGTYTVSMYVNKGACQSVATKIIRVDIPSKLEVPNVFTPNGDGSNDLFFLRVANLTEITALIYDRWGHKIFELTSNTGNIAWDGKNQVGSEVPEGTYFYIITAKGKDGKDYDTKGTVNLYR